MFKTTVMKTEILRENFIAALNEQLPPGTNLAKYLSAVLYMGKEAVYRRLRGDVAFSFEEAAAISEKMDVSLDQIVRQSASKGFFLNTASSGDSDPTERYCALLDSKIANQQKVINSVRSEVGSSSNSLPSVFLFGYDNVSKFSTYKWLYQFPRVESPPSYSEIHIDPKLRRLQHEYADNFKKLDYVYFVWDDKLFLNYVKDVEYFYNLRLLSEKDVAAIHGELLELVDYLEKIASTGEFENGNKVDIFISNTSLESTYTYVETNTLHLSLIKIFYMSSVISRDVAVFEGFKEWVQTLRRVSILISKSGELQRVHFFRKQRDIVNTLIP